MWYTDKYYIEHTNIRSSILKRKSWNMYCRHAIRYLHHSSKKQHFNILGTEIYKQLQAMLLKHHWRYNYQSGSRSFVHIMPHLKKFFFALINVIYIIHYVINQYTYMPLTTLKRYKTHLILGHPVHSISLSRSCHFLTHLFKRKPLWGSYTTNYSTYFPSENLHIKIPSVCVGGSRDLLVWCRSFTNK